MDWFGIGLGLTLVFVYSSLTSVYKAVEGHLVYFQANKQIQHIYINKQKDQWFAFVFLNLTGS